MINASISNSNIETDNQSDRRHRVDTSQSLEEPATLQSSSDQKNPRRRHIDPTTCERDYTIQEREFMLALDDYKRASGRMFPTCSEILEVIRNLGYIQSDLPSRSAGNGVNADLDLPVI